MNSDEANLAFAGTVVATGLIVWAIISGIRIIRQTHRGLVERFGKFNRILGPGINLIIPFVEHVHYRNITERIADVKPQDIITKDNLNARVDLQIYYKVKDTREDIKNSYYSVDDFKTQIISLAQTTARNVIGDMKFSEVNNQRNKLNKSLTDIMSAEIADWGVEVVRVELKEITPPADVQTTMNNVIKAQNEKDAAIDFAQSVETKADGERRAKIKEAEGYKQSLILKAEGEAEAIKIVNEAADKYFKGNAVELRRIEQVEKSLKDNTKVFVVRDLPDIFSGKVFNNA